MAFFTAVSRLTLAGPPRLMFATAGLIALAATQLIPAITWEFVPEPPQSRTRTATRVTLFATPTVLPPIVPATCVPCPWQSLASESLSMKSSPESPDHRIARDRSECQYRGHKHELQPHWKTDRNNDHPWADYAGQCGRYPRMGCSSGRIALPCHLDHPKSEIVWSSSM